jgi:predicted transcriptional regulator
MFIYNECVDYYGVTMKYERKFKNEPIPDEWIIEAIKNGHRTTDDIVKELKIHKNTMSNKVRQMLADGKIERDTSRVPYYYFVPDEQT